MVGWHHRLNVHEFEQAPVVGEGQGMEGSLEYEGTTRRGTNTPVHHPEKPAGYTHSSTSGLSPREQLERQEESHPPEKTRPDSPVPTCRDLAI